LDAERIGQAVALAALPDAIRGYGHVKERHLKAVRIQWEQLLHAWRHPPVVPNEAALAEPSLTMATLHAK
ncbi:MAG TPA: DUF6537 domain-containing protein, partial [Burkholderiaceae bacterium]|nr:DUF6537 domain-containing protein [Burkholderiaceae bacterium]